MTTSRAALLTIALAGCGSTPIQQGKPLSPSDLVGCYVAPDEIALQLKLSETGNFNLNIQTHIGSLDSSKGSWELVSNKIYLHPEHPDRRPFGLNGPIYVYRDGDRFALKYQDAKGERTTSWGKLRAYSCT